MTPLKSDSPGVVVWYRPTIAGTALDVRQERAVSNFPSSSTGCQLVPDTLGADVANSRILAGPVSVDDLIYFPNVPNV